MTLISINLDETQSNFIKKNKGDKTCSPTFLLRRAINERMSQDSDSFQESNTELRKKIERLMETIQKQANFINERGLLNEFINYD